MDYALVLLVPLHVREQQWHQYHLLGVLGENAPHPGKAHEWGLGRLLGR